MSVNSVGVGLDVAVSFALETTPNTRVAPDTSVYIVQESLQRNQQFIRSSGMGGGRQLLRTKALGTYAPAGSVALDVGTAEAADLFRFIFGGNPSPSGAGPYTRTFAGLGDLPSATWQPIRPFGGGTQPFDYVGAYCSSATFTQNPDEYLRVQMDIEAYDEVTDQTAATFAPPAAEQLLTFQGVTITPYAGSAECFDSFELTVDNNLDRQSKVCAADAGRVPIRHGGMRSVTGTLTDDFKNMSHYNRYVAGTEGSLVFAYTGANSSTLTITLNVFFTGETPTVSDAGPVKQGIPFEVLHATSDASAITVELVNGES